MDIPVLKYLDVLIGLAVVMVLGTTLVGAVTQLILSSMYFRSRTLRLALQELIKGLDSSQITDNDARTVAELLLRHPLLSRPSGTFGVISNWFHNKIRVARSLPILPPSNPADVIQRSELTVLLMEWASNDGPFANVLSAPVVTPGEPLREKLLRVLVNNGMGDPAGVLKTVRLRAIENERNQPGLPSHLWWNGALLQEAASDFVGKVNHAFDNAMARATQAFKLKASSVACVISLFVAFFIQLDSLALLKRLSMDDKLRDSLVEEAKALEARIDKAEKKEKDSQGSGSTTQPGQSAPGAEVRQPAPSPTPPDQTAAIQNEARQEAANAKTARDEIDATLAMLRQPKFALIPDTLAWDQTAQGTVCPPQDAWTGTLHVGPQQFRVTLPGGKDLRMVENAIVQTRAPVYVYRINEGLEDCLRIVARAPSPEKAFLRMVTSENEPLFDAVIDYDRAGVRQRFAGVVLSWVLLSLGTPFWFNLMKRLLSLRSALAQKDDKERAERELSIQPEKLTPPIGSSADPPKTVQAMEGEMGDLDQTGAAG